MDIWPPGITLRDHLNIADDLKAVQLENTFPGRLDTSPWTTLTILQSMNHVFVFFRPKLFKQTLWDPLSAEKSG